MLSEAKQLPVRRRSFVAKDTLQDSNTEALYQFFTTTMAAFPG